MPVTQAKPLAKEQVTCATDAYQALDMHTRGISRLPLRLVYLVVALHSEPDLGHGVQVHHVCSSSVATPVLNINVPHHIHHQQQLSPGFLQASGPLSPAGFASLQES